MIHCNFHAFIKSVILFTLLILSPLFFVVEQLNAQSNAKQNPPKRELRGVWIASVFNIDYPRTPSVDDQSLAREWFDMLTKLKAIGINALFVQVRPTSDAFYRSKIEPWSMYLTGQSGVAPANNFDPLSYMVQSAHEMGFEFHAWLNPYRVSMDNPNKSKFSPSHVINKHPEWCIFYNKRYILNPGLPEVQSHLNDVIGELVTNYDIDGIHFDDYFYPYKEGNESFNDYETYSKLGIPQGFTNQDDWRRHNVDILMWQLSKTIKDLKPRVQFGISPFGVWRNASKDPLGSKTQAGQTCYDDLYSDVRKWLQEGWIDYVVPQAYWQMGFSIADYSNIVSWWADNSFGKPVYVGHGAYRVGQTLSKEPAWKDPNEIPRQIKFARSIPNVKGSVFFSAKTLLLNPLGVSDSLRYNYFNQIAIPPQVVKDTSLLMCEPPEIRELSYTNNYALLRWKPSIRTKRRLPFQYLVYRFKVGAVDFTNSKNIIAIVPYDTKQLQYIDKTANDGESYLYAVTVVDCQNREAPADEVVALNKPQVKKPTIPTIDPNDSLKNKKKKRGFFGWLFNKG